MSKQGFFQPLTFDPEINDDFKSTFELLEYTNTSVFITGKAGTGKSTLLKYFYFNSRKNLVLLAPTGIAALNIGGMTIHRFFHFPPTPINPDDVGVIRDELYKAIDTIVIDEISMVRADLLDGIDRSMRLNGRDPFLPFGGVQMVFFGDLYQLSPIVSDEEEAKYLSTHYDNPWFFSAHALRNYDLKYIELNKVYRQKDVLFINLLDRIRKNEFLSSDLDLLNSQHEVFSPLIDDDVITLTCTKKKSHILNCQKLSKLSTQKYTYFGKIEGEFPKKILPVDCELHLKIGAHVMFVNNDPSRRWVNGTMGKISKLDEESIEVEVQVEGEHYFYDVERFSWEIPKYKYDFSKRRINIEIIGRFTQFPLKLAWAVTIHKSQGLTFDKLKVDLENGAFTIGQVYVALSRSTSLNGIILIRPVAASDIKVDITINRFLKNIKFLTISEIKSIIQSIKFNNELYSLNSISDNITHANGNEIIAQPHFSSDPTTSNKARDTIQNEGGLIISGAQFDNEPRTMYQPRQENIQSVINGSEKYLDRLSISIANTNSIRNAASTKPIKFHDQRPWIIKLKERYPDEIRGLKVLGVFCILLLVFLFFKSLLSGTFSVDVSPVQSANIVVSTKSAIYIFPTQTRTKAPPTKSSKPTSVATKTEVNHDACLDIVSSLSIRECPGNNYKVIDYLLKGECVNIVGRDKTKTWGMIEKGGWVNIAYLDYDAEFIKLPILACVED